MAMFRQMFADESKHPDCDFVSIGFTPVGRQLVRTPNLLRMPGQARTFAMIYSVRNTGIAFALVHPPLASCHAY